MAAYAPTDVASQATLPHECLLVIDTSYTDTTILPLYNGKLLQSAVRRLTVGGKLLTNQLKELVSFRQWNMMDETHIMNDVKQKCCFVSLDYKRDIEACRCVASPRPSPSQARPGPLPAAFFISVCFFVFTYTLTRRARQCRPRTQLHSAGIYPP